MTLIGMHDYELSRNKKNEVPPTPPQVRPEDKSLEFGKISNVNSKNETDISF
jgi:hypothetical protein